MEREKRARKSKPARGDINKIKGDLKKLKKIYKKKVAVENLYKKQKEKSLKDLSDLKKKRKRERASLNKLVGIVEKKE